MANTVKLKNLRTGREEELDAWLWAKRKDQYKGIFIEVKAAKVPDEVKALKKKQAAPIKESPEMEDIPPPLKDGE